MTPFPIKVVSLIVSFLKLRSGRTTRLDEHLDRDVLPGLLTPSHKPQLSLLRRLDHGTFTRFSEVVNETSSSLRKSPDLRLVVVLDRVHSPSYPTTVVPVTDCVS